MRRERVEVLLRNKLGKILMGRKPTSGGWIFPGGGIDEGETPVEAARREVQEETGKNVRNLKQISNKPFVYTASNGYTPSTTHFIGELASGRRSKIYGIDSKQPLN